MFGGIGTPEIVLLIIAIGLLFGGKNLLNFARSAGRFGGEFKKGKMEVEEELKNLKDINSDKK